MMPPDAPEDATDESGYEESTFLTDQEEDDLNEAEQQPLAVIYSGQDFDAEGLVRRLGRDDILIPTFGHADDRISSAGFQRGFVWTRSQMDRFIETLLLGYPIPGIFLVKQQDRRYLVLDGQQRLRTLQHFYAGVHDGREFVLRNVGDRFKGVSYKTLHEEQRRQLDNSYFQATIVDTDGSEQSLEAIYQIFERLNSGGTQLTPHEIRVALYAGPFIDFLDELNRMPSWRQLYGKPSPRVRDQELILRILALHFDGESYTRPLKSFLNRFVAEHRMLTDLPIAEIRTLFEQAANLMLEGPGREAIRPRGRQVNAALTEAIFVGLLKRLTMPAGPSPEAVTQAVGAISDDPNVIDSTTGGTADEEKVKTRIGRAIDHLARA
jgi:hypothetical protein